MNNPEKVVEIHFGNDFGEFVWFPNLKAVEERIFEPLKRELAADGKERRYSEARIEAAQCWRNVFLYCMQCASEQAVAETLAIAKASVAHSKRERWEFAEEVAEWARTQSLERVKYHSHGLILPVKRGEKKRPTTAESLTEIILEFRALERIVIDKVKEILREKNCKPTLSKVAEKMQMGGPASGKAHDTGRVMLSRKLAKLRSGKTGGDVLKEFVETAKRELSEEKI